MQDKIVSRKLRVKPPETFTSLEVKPRIEVAAGKIAVYESLKHGFREMGVVNSMKALLKMNQQDGFDCPSCAWPDPAHPSKVAEYCENGAKALADEATQSHIGADFFAENSIESLSLKSDYELNQYGRLTEPLILRKGSMHYESIGWPEAFEIIAAELHHLKNPDEAIFYTSGRSSNEAAFLYGMLARALGTNNLPDCSNMCHESSGIALSEMLGIGKGSTTLEDLYKAEVIIVAGQNPGTNHPRMLSALEKCKENGGAIISINPLRETGLVSFSNPQRVKGWLGSGEPMADLHLPVHINQDIPLVKLILKKMAALDAIDGTVFDHDFIQTYTEGYEALVKDLNSYYDTELLTRSGVSEEKIDAAVQLLAKSKKIIICWAMGLTQHKNGVETIREYVNLLLLKGAIGKAHSGTCPVRGHSNVQGDRSVGIQHFVDHQLNERIEKYLGFKAPTHEGVDTVGSIQAMHDGKTKVFMCLGGNFLMAAPDTEYTARALQNCRLTVQVSTKLNRTHLVTGETALILPTYGRSEKDEGNGSARFVTVENSMGQVRRSRGMLKPASEAIMSEPEIVGGLGEAYFKGKHPIDWKVLGKDYDLIREKIDQVAKGFENTGNRSEGRGYYLPNNTRTRDFSMLPNGKAQFKVNSLPKHKLEKGEYLLMTIRSHDQFNTTIYGLDDRYRGIYGERRVVFMNKDDMELAGLEPQAVVTLTSTYDKVTRTAPNFKVVSYEIPPGNLAAYFPETNVLVPYNKYADGSKTPISKSLKVRVIRSGSET